MPSAVMSVSIDEEHKARFAAHCKALDTTPSAFVRSAVLTALGEGSAPVEQVDEPNDSARVPVRIWLTEAERTAVDKHVEHVGGSRSAWVARAIRGALTRDPQLGETEASVLGESNTALLALGQALDDIARRMPTAALAAHITPDALGKLGRRIDTHVERVHDLIRASRDRWPLARRDG